MFGLAVGIFAGPGWLFLWCLITFIGICVTKPRYVCCWLMTWLVVWFLLSNGFLYIITGC